MDIIKKVNRFRKSPTAIAIVVSLCLFTDMVVYGIVIPVLPTILVQRLNLDDSYMGLLISSYAAGLILVTPVVGWLSDRYRNRQMPMLFGLAALMSTTIAFAYSTTLAGLVVARMAQGASGGITWTIGFCMIADVFPPDRLGTVMGSVLIANTIGFLVGPPIGGFFFQYYGDKAPFWFCSALAVVDLLGRLFVRTSNVHPAHELLPSGSSTPTTTMSISENDDPSSYSEADTENPLALSQATTNAFKFSKVLTNPQMIVTLLSVIVNATVFAGIEPTLPLYLSAEFNATPLMIGGLWMMIVIPSMVGYSGAGYISDRYGRKNIAAIGMFLFAASSIILATHNLPVLMAGLCFFGITNAIGLTPALPELADFCHQAGNKSFGIVYSLYNVAYSTGMLVGPLLGSWIYQEYGFVTQMIVFAVLLVVCAPISLAFYYLGNQ